MIRVDKEKAIRHCIACCDGALTDDQRVELDSRIGGLIEALREEHARLVHDRLGADGYGVAQMIRKGGENS